MLYNRPKRQEHKYSLFDNSTGQDEDICDSLASFEAFSTRPNGYHDHGDIEDKAIHTMLLKVLQAVYM